MLRPGLVHRFRVQLPLDVPYADDEQARLVIAVFAGETALMQRDMGAVEAQDLRRGLTINWVVPEDISLRQFALWFSG